MGGAEARRRVAARAAQGGPPAGGPAPADGDFPQWSDVGWLPPLEQGVDDALPSTPEDAEVDLDAPPPASGTQTIPLFPLGSQPYMPYSQQVLNIFEPRYRALYDDILLNGSRRVAVPLVRPKDDDVLGGGSLQLADTAPVFYLESLKEVSEQTNDSVKYVCVHQVMDQRVRLKKVLNPSRWFDRSTYLVAEYEPCEDTDDAEDLADEEARVASMWNEVHDLQARSEEEVRLAAGVCGDSVTMSRGGETGGLWRSLSVWYELITQRCSRKQSAVEDRIQEILRAHFEGEGAGSGDSTPRSVRLSDLPEKVRSDIFRVQQEYQDEVPDEIQALIRNFSYMATADSHASRLRVFSQVLDSERRRLAARASLKSLFES